MDLNGDGVVDEGEFKLQVIFQLFLGLTIVRPKFLWSLLLYFSPPFPAVVWELIERVHRDTSAARHMHCTTILTVDS